MLELHFSLQCYNPSTYLIWATGFDKILMKDSLGKSGFKAQKE